MVCSTSVRKEFIRMVALIGQMLAGKLHLLAFASGSTSSSGAGRLGAMGSRLWTFAGRLAGKTMIGAAVHRPDGARLDPWFP
jgi:hypothetical protein